MSGLLYISEDAGVSTLESAASLIGTVPRDRSGGVLSGGVYLGERAEGRG